MRTTAAILAALTITAACGGAGPTTPIGGGDPTPALVSPDIIRVAVGESVTFTVGRNDPESVISALNDLPIHYRPVRIRSAVGVTAELRLVGETVPQTKIWQPGTMWYCCGPPVAVVYVPGGNEVEVEIQNPPGYGGTQTLTLVASRVGP